MDVKRIVVLGVSGGAIAVWLASAATATRPAPVAPIVPKPHVVEISGAQLAAEISRLRDRLRPDAVPAEQRDLFRYSPRRSSASVSAVPAVPAADVAPARPLAPALKLVGMADDTAII